MIALTFDIDWAPDSIVRSVLSVLDNYCVPATLFCTNYLKDLSGSSSNLVNLVDPRHELGLHPDFQGVMDYSRVWEELICLYPAARGWRSHNGVTGWPIVKEGIARGLSYEVFSPVFEGYVPPSQVNGALPGYLGFSTAFWDSHRLHDDSFEWRAKDLPLKKHFNDPGKLVVLGFHPNILYYDMRSVSEYEARKPRYHEPDEMESFLNRPPHGAMRLLVDLLNFVSSAHFCTMADFSEKMGHRKC